MGVILSRVSRKGGSHEKTLHYEVDGKPVDRVVNYIPVRFILAIVFAILETAAVIAAVIACSYYIPYFYLPVWATEIAVVIKIIASDDNPDYKIPWLMVVLLIPVAGFMMYFLFYDRKLQASISINYEK